MRGAREHRELRLREAGEIAYHTAEQSEQLDGMLEADGVRPCPCSSTAMTCRSSASPDTTLPIASIVM